MHPSTCVLGTCLVTTRHIRYISSELKYYFQFLSRPIRPFGWANSHSIANVLLSILPNIAPSNSRPQPTNQSSRGAVGTSFKVTLHLAQVSNGVHDHWTLVCGLTVAVLDWSAESNSSMARGSGDTLRNLTWLSRRYLFSGAKG